VLLNARRHLAKRRHAVRADAALDPASSARWFDGWRAASRPALEGTAAAPEVARPRTWMLRVGWRRHGLVDPAEVLGAATMPAT
jgi:putative transposase